MKPTITRIFVVAMGISSVVGVSSCVDDDYDLSKDIDMTVQIGSEGFTLPASNTEPCTLSQILDLESTSSIKAVAEGQYGLHEGDYALIQTGSSDPSTVKVDEVSLDELSGTTTVTELDEFRGTGSKVTVDANGTPTTISLKDDEVTRELVSLEAADMSVQLDFEIGFTSRNFSGEAIIEPGYRAVFDPSWVLEIDDAHTASFLRMADSHTVVFTRAMPVRTASKLVGRLHLVRVDFTKIPGQGLVSPGHFSMDCDVKTDGKVSIDGTQLPMGQTALLDLVTSTVPVDARLLTVTGVVDPVIDIDRTTIEVNDIPDFLTTDENVLDIENPRISFSVYNGSPVRINLNAVLTAVDRDGQSREVGVGNSHGTGEIVIGADRTTHFVVSRRPLDTGSAVNIVVPELGDLIKTIPEHIDFNRIEAKALPDVVTMTLGTEYSYDCDYEAIIPLAFGSDLKLHYTHEDTGWDEDLHKYNFNEVHVTADVVSTLPMVMVPAVKALRTDGSEISDIYAEITGKVGAGTTGAPTTSPIEIVLRSEAENLAQLDGIRLIFDGTTDSEHVGVNLNKAQSLKFNNVIIKIVGGVTVDLND